jgi:hypothetical protein
MSTGTSGHWQPAKIFCKVRTWTDTIYLQGCLDSTTDDKTIITAGKKNRSDVTQMNGFNGFIYTWEVTGSNIGPTNGYAGFFHESLKYFNVNVETVPQKSHYQFPPRNICRHTTEKAPWNNPRINHFICSANTTQRVYTQFARYNPTSH